MPKLLEQVREVCRTKHLSLRTEESYTRWIRRYVRFHGTRHPAQMGQREIRAFLSHLATVGNVAASTQNQALAALVFLYRQVLDVDLPRIEDVVRARRARKLPVVFTREETAAVLAQLTGTHRLVACLLYGAGLRLSEALRLRVKDLDFAPGQILVRDGKGQKDRVTVLPQRLQAPLQEHLRRTRTIHQRDLQEGFGAVYLPTEDLPAQCDVHPSLLHHPFDRDSHDPTRLHHLGRDTRRDASRRHTDGRPGDQRDARDQQARHHDEDHHRNARRRRSCSGRAVRIALHPLM